MTENIKSSTQNQLKIILTLGLPASGKTTWATQFALENSYMNICKDDIRYANPNIKEKKVIELRDTKTVEMLERGISVIWSDTNFNPIHKARAEELRKQFNAVVEIKDFTNVGLEECIKRDIPRGTKAVGEKVIKKMYYKYVYKPEVIEHNPNLPNCYIFDIDGTLALKSPERGYFEWNKVDLDLPNSPVIKLCNILGNTPNAKMFIFSGRDESCRDITCDWLESFLQIGIWLNDKLFMRPAGNQEDDRIIKKQMYLDHIKDKYNVLGVIDDRTKVCRMWRELGLPVFQVGNPDREF
jgi:predicted kinase